MTRVPPSWVTETFHVLICLLVPVGFNKFSVLSVKSPEGLLTVHLTCTDKHEFITAHSSDMSGRERKDGTMYSKTCGNHCEDVNTSMTTYINLFVQIHTYISFRILAICSSQCFLLIGIIILNSSAIFSEFHFYNKLNLITIYKIRDQTAVSECLTSELYTQSLILGHLSFLLKQVKSLMRSESSSLAHRKLELIWSEISALHSQQSQACKSNCINTRAQVMAMVSMTHRHPELGLYKGDTPGKQFWDQYH